MSSKDRKKLQSVEESYLIEMANAGVIDEAAFAPVITGTARVLAKGVGAVVKGVAKGGYKVAKWAAKKAIKTARERLTTKGKMERQTREVKKAKALDAHNKEREKLLKVKQAQRQQKKAKLKKAWNTATGWGSNNP